jgi:hypothetical protein
MRYNCTANAQAYVEPIYNTFKKPLIPSSKILSATKQQVTKFHISQNQLPKSIHNKTKP